MEDTIENNKGKKKKKKDKSLFNKWMAFEYKSYTYPMN